MSDIPTRSGRPVEDPRLADPDDHEKAKDWNAQQYVPNRILSWRAFPKYRKSTSPVWIGLGLILCALLVVVVFGSGYLFIDAQSQTLQDYLRANLAAAIVALAFFVVGIATMIAGCLRRGKAK